MIRYAAAIAVVLYLSPSRLCAQSTTTFTVNTASADVHKSPSTGSPVIGKARRGAVLDVTRELGSWVKVVWPGAQDDAGYVHVSTGLIAHGSTPVPNRAAGVTSKRPATASASPPPTAQPPQRVDAREPVAPMRTEYVRTPSHIVGLGAEMVGPNLGVGATARAWPRKRLGLQFDVSRYALVDAPGRLTCIQFTSSLLYSLPDRVTDYLWVRPYLGGGPSLQRQTPNGGTTGAGDPVSDTRLGFQAFGGGEVTFASVPRFALSADLGYHWLPTSFTGFQLSGLGLSVSGHWYVK